LRKKSSSLAIAAFDEGVFAGLRRLLAIAVMGTNHVCKLAPFRKQSCA
jgi:hypothetical protein